MPIPTRSSAPRSPRSKCAPTCRSRNCCRLLPYKLNDLAGMRPFRVEGPTIFLTDGPKDTLDGRAAGDGDHRGARRAGGTGAAGKFCAHAVHRHFPVTRTCASSPPTSSALAAMQTHQLLAEAKDAKTDADVKIVQWVRFGNGAYSCASSASRTRDVWPDTFTTLPHCARRHRRRAKTALARPTCCRSARFRPARSWGRPLTRRPAPDAGCDRRS